MAASPQDEVERGRFVSADTHADVAVVVVTYNSASDIPLLIDDLRVAAHYRPIRLIVVDNQSSDGTVELIRAHNDIMLVESGGNLGYGGGMNAGLRLVGHCDAVLMLNPDLRLAPDAITRLFEAVNENQIGAVVPLILDDDGATYSSLRREPSLSRAIGDALLGSKMWRNRPAFLSELDYRPASYVEAARSGLGDRSGIAGSCRGCTARWESGGASSLSTRRRPTTSAGFAKPAAGFDSSRRRW